jgi:hypothetical protein
MMSPHGIWVMEAKTNGRMENGSAGRANIPHNPDRIRSEGQNVMAENNPTKDKCATPGCPNVRRNKGRDSNGGVIVGRFCHTCHRQRSETSCRYAINNSTCSECGWDKAPCDRHRIDPKGGYKPGNVVVLCPNCHRLVTLGLLTIRVVAA